MKVDLIADLISSRSFAAVMVLLNNWQTVSELASVEDHVSDSFYLTSSSLAASNGLDRGPNGISKTYHGQFLNCHLYFLLAAEPLVLFYRPY
jgi:hypothetical protein